MAFKRPESVLVVIYSACGKVLLLQRRDKPDFWQSVTGSLEWGESAESAAKRELFEETGLSGESIVNCQISHSFTLFPHWRHRYPPRVRRNREHLFVFKCDVSNSVILSPSEHLAYEWLDWKDATEKVFSWSNRDAIKRCFS